MTDQAARESRTVTRALCLFVLVHCVLWTLVPFVRSHVYGDSAEALAWGLTWEWGTNKHPPLTGWLLDIAYRVTGSTDVAVYALAQLCVGGALVYVYTLSRRFLPPRDALFCALFLEGTVYYTVNSVNYNPNVLSLFLVPAVVYHFYIATRENHTFHWILAGLFAGLSLLTKYTNGIVLTSLFLYLVLTPTARSLFRRHGPYLAAAVAVAVFFPHLAWLARYDFHTLAYSQSKVMDEPDTVAHILRGLRSMLAVFFGQLPKVALTLGLFASLFFTTPKPMRRFVRRLDPFLFYAGVVPLIILSILALVLATSSYPKYAYAFMGSFPLLLFSLFPVSPTPAARRRTYLATYAVMAALICLSGYRELTRTQHLFTSRAFVAAVEKKLTEKNIDPPYYVGGPISLVSLASAYLPSRPRPFFHMDPEVVVWENKADLASRPILILAATDDEYALYQEKYPAAPPPTRLAIPRPSLPPYPMYCGILIPSP